MAVSLGQRSSWPRRFARGSRRSRRRGDTLLARVERNLADGRAWKARDRLQGALATAPHDVALLDRLGEVCFAMGDLPAAGRAWLLAGRDDEPARAALAALAERAPAAGERLRVLGARAPLERYPAIAQERIAALRAQADDAGDRWAPRPVGGGRALADPRADEEDEDAAATVILGAVLLLTVGIWLVGAGFLVSLLLRAIA